MTSPESTEFEDDWEFMSPDDAITARLGELGLGSLSATQRILRQHHKENGDVHKCLKCSQFFDTFKSLRTHLSRSMHLKNLKKDIKSLRTGFINERLKKDGIQTIQEAQLMFDEGKPRVMSAGERATWVEYNMQRSWLVELSNKSR